LFKLCFVGVSIAEMPDRIYPAFLKITLCDGKLRMVPQLWRLKGEENGNVWDAGRQQLIDKPNHGLVCFDPNFAIDNPQQDRCRA